ncbi:chemotaxis protein CheB [Gloeocapsopsis dulcis]|uniref:protein-glutamate methylesterase n=1 Tax=Gloeocapsopsis dulcis AAB1 = 1H9 TaxID=1433147 RepID=A0A6N8FRK2_9CHRO|nr:chemotaxis protein CheB [Gloeocapsopsis dulcis]MUL35733.1 chemotaxis protein CheB [Gloeocapsopsis dulcis AAB1 = 1H9]WNN90984.1 chemotaxis protein CheB [Gloeocapsopsis dulcis]
MISQYQHKILAHFPNVAFNVVAIAASKGGLNAISNIVSALPSDFPAAILVVQHLSPLYPSYMAKLLSYHTALQVKNASSGELLRPSKVYVAVPDWHLMVNSNGKVYLSKAAKVNFVRPSANLLFQSVASSYKTRAIGVVLSGRGTDGVLGALTIKKHGGTVIAQDEASCECFEMPQATINTGKVDFVLPPNAIAATLISLVMAERVA